MTQAEKQLRDDWKLLRRFLSSERVTWRGDEVLPLVELFNRFEAHFGALGVSKEQDGNLP